MRVAVVILIVFVLYVGIDTIIGLSTELKAASVCVTDPGYHAMEATAYCLHGTTASGAQTRSGICAGKREWIGCTACVYADNDGEVGDLIGIYKVEDTGGKSIRNGSVLDIWMPTREECMKFGRRKVHVYILEGE